MQHCCILMRLLEAVPPLLLASLHGIPGLWGNVLAVVRCNTAIFLVFLLRAVPFAPCSLSVSSLLGGLWEDCTGCHMRQHCYISNVSSLDSTPLCSLVASMAFFTAGRTLGEYTGCCKMQHCYISNVSSGSTPPAPG